MSARGVPLVLYCACLSFALACSGVHEAQDAGVDAPLSPAACAESTECVIAYDACCFCGEPTLSDVVAIRASERAAYESAICEGMPACPPCVPSPRADLIATCGGGTCEAIDLHTRPATECFEDSQCMIRYANCCSCSGTDAEVIAVRGDAAAFIDTYLCAGGACALDCAITSDPDFVARCASGRCEAVRVAP